jgi:capsid protein
MVAPVGAETVTRSHLKAGLTAYGAPMMNTSEHRFLPPSRAELREQQRRHFAEAMLYRARAGDDAPGALAVAVANRANPRIIAILKASVPALNLGTDSGDALALYTSGASAWLESLQWQSFFDACLPDMRPVAMLTRGAVVTTALVADSVEEGFAKPVANLTVASIEALRPRKAAGLAVVTQELLRRTEGARELLDREMRAAVAYATDVAFLASLIAATTPIASTGDSADDLAALLAAVTLSASSRLHYAVRPEAAAALATARSNGVQLWPEMSPAGGRMAGIPVTVSDALAAGTAVLLDAAQVNANGGTIEVDASSQADIVMDTAPAMDSGGGSPAAPTARQVVSLFQTNCIAIRAERLFGYQLGRTTAVSSLSGISYTGGSP